MLLGYRITTSGVRCRALLDELREGTDRAQNSLCSLFVTDCDTESALDLHHQLQRVDRIESQTFAEQRHIVGDLGRRHLQAQAPDNDFLYSKPQTVIHLAPTANRRRR